ncbi:MAG: phenylacetate--CoA ligase family protein, partial [Proteobacteria bacterium]|nr:phenylacetate--CoA ligase family protein [Pseudomonadota bacterium]
MEKPFMPVVKTAQELLALQLEGLKWSVTHAYNGSRHYRAKFDETGVKPADIKTLDDIQKLPFVSSKDLQEGYPFPLLSVPFKDIVRIHASSGTTGKRKILCYTAKDIDDWAEMFARCYAYADCTAEDR